MTDIENLNDINPVILVCNNISKSFHENNNDLVVLKNIDLSIHSGERVAITGASGSGKTTLLQIMSGLDEPSSGEVRIDGELVNKIAEVRKSFIRNRYIGFVYQFHHLLVEFSDHFNGKDGKTRTLAKKDRDIIINVNMLLRHPNLIH